MTRFVKLSLIAVMALVVFAPINDASAAQWSLTAKSALAAAAPASDIQQISRWDRHPRRHLRYSLPPDIFKPRCWINRWGVMHCPYRRRGLRHSERRNCTVNSWGKLICH